MTDSKLRELERRWKETQSVQDEAAYLLERVRVGDLEREKLELAAYCGHEGARAALVESVPQRPEQLAHLPEHLRELDAFIRGLNRWGDYWFVQALIALTRAILSHWSDEYVNDERPEGAISATEKWLDSPTDDHADICLVTSQEALEAAESRAASTRVVEFLCGRNPVAEMGPEPEDTVIQVMTGQATRLDPAVAASTLASLAFSLHGDSVPMSSARLVIVDCAQRSLGSAAEVVSQVCHTVGPQALR